MLDKVLNTKLIFSFYRDGVLSVGDELVNINGKRLRGVSVDSARQILTSCGHLVSEAVVATSGLDLASLTHDTGDTIILWSDQVRSHKRTPH